MFRVMVKDEHSVSMLLLAEFAEIEQAREAADSIAASGEHEGRDVVVTDTGDNVVYKGVK